MSKGARESKQEIDFLVRHPLSDVLESMICPAQIRLITHTASVLKGTNDANVTWNHGLSLGCIQL